MREFGSLVSPGEFGTAGNMMGGLIDASLMVEACFARLITRRTEPCEKLH